MRNDSADGLTDEFTWRVEKLEHLFKGAEESLLGSVVKIVGKCANHNNSLVLALLRVLLLLIYVLF